MKKFVQKGDVLSLIAPSGGVTKDVGYVIGGIFVVAMTSAAQGESFLGKRGGVSSLAKSGSLTFTAGEKAFWDDTAKAIKKTSSGYFMIGCFLGALGSVDAFGDVVLDGITVTAV